LLVYGCHALLKPLDRRVIFEDSEAGGVTSLFGMLEPPQLPPPVRYMPSEDIGGAGLEPHRVQTFLKILPLKVIREFLLVYFDGKTQSATVVECSIDKSRGNDA
jgi:hypothetical protein